MTKQISILFTLLAPTLTHAQSAAPSHPSTDDAATLDAIRSAYLEGRANDAVVLADKALPGGWPIERAEIHFLRGAALVRLKRFEEALVAFEKSEELGFTDLRFHLERAIAHRELGQDEDADRSFQEAERQAQDDPEKLELLRRRWSEKVDHEKRFQLRVTPQLGYDSNILSLDDSEASDLLAEESDDKSFYYGGIIAARYLIVDEQRFGIMAEYRNHLRGYANEPDRSFTDNLIMVEVRGRPSGLDWLTLQIAAAYGESWMSEDGHFRTLRSVSPSIRIEPTETWEARIWADVASLDYYESEAPAEQDRDATWSRVGLEVLFKFAAGWQVGPFASWSDHDAEGSDYEHRALEIGLMARTPEFLGLELDVRLGFVRADFENFNSLSEPAFSDKREDRRFSIRVTITFRELERSWGVTPRLSITYENWNSNVDVFDFDRWDIAPMVEIAALSF